MSKFVGLILFAGLFMVNGVWAACTENVDMQGGRILNLTMDNDSVPSEGATAEYLKKVVEMRGNGSTFSASFKNNLTWSEANAYCNDLESFPLSRENEMLNERLYNNWRLPTLSEWMHGCYMQGSSVQVYVEEGANDYLERREQPRRSWEPAGVCGERHFGAESVETVSWWTKRHSAETEAGDRVIFEDGTNTVDPIYKATPPEADGIIRNVAFGLPQTWNPITSTVERVRGDEKKAVRCIR